MTYDDYLKAEQDDERMTRSFQALIDAAIADKIAKGLPVARYDAQKDQSYH